MSDPTLYKLIVHFTGTTPTITVGVTGDHYAAIQRCVGERTVIVDDYNWNREEPLKVTINGKLVTSVQEVAVAANATTEWSRR